MEETTRSAPLKPDYGIDAPGVGSRILRWALLLITFGSLRPDIVTARKPAP